MRLCGGMGLCCGVPWGHVCYCVILSVVVSLGPYVLPCSTLSCAVPGLCV